MGAVLVDEYREEMFTMENASSLDVRFNIKLDSVSPLRFSKAQNLPKFVKHESSNFIGVQNMKGRRVFDCVPADGVIGPGEKTEVTVTFAPDHQSDNFSDGVRIELFDADECHAFKVQGQAKAKIMYMQGGDAVGPDVESLAALPILEGEAEEKGE